MALIASVALEVVKSTIHSTSCTSSIRGVSSISSLSDSSNTSGRDFAISTDWSADAGGSINQIHMSP